MKKSSELKDLALQSLKGKWGLCVMATIIYFVISGIAGAIYVSALITLPLGWGFSVFFLRLARREAVDFGNLFDGFKDYLRIFLTTLLQSIYVALWSLLLIVPGIIKGYSYAMTSFVMADDHEVKYNEAIERSMAMMAGHKMELFMLDLSMIGWILLSILTLGLGSLWLTPYISTAHAHFYEELKAAGAEPAAAV